MSYIYAALKRTAVAAALVGLLQAPSPAGEEHQEYFCRDIKKPFFSAEPAPGGGLKVRPGRPRALAFEFLAPKPSGTARVFVIGESAAGLLGRGEDRLLEFLGRAFPGQVAELVNCGMPGYESRRVLEVFGQALVYQPDLLVVLSGNNETGQDFCPDFRSDLDRRARRIKTRLAGLSLPAAEAAGAVSLAIHESRLREMAALARKARVPVLFCTLPANLKDFAPSGYPPPEAEAGIRLAGKDPGAALSALSRRGLRGEPFALFYSGRALEALGRYAEAREKYEAAVKYDPALDRSSSERNAMIRRVAKEEGACLADLEAAFSAAASNGITGGEQLADGVHWFKTYSPFVSAELGRAAAACLAADPSKIPVPSSLLPSKPGADDFQLVLSYAGAYAMDLGGSRARPGAPAERVITALQRLYRLDRARLERLLRDPGLLRKELRESSWTPSLKTNLEKWRPALLRAAVEMLRRAGRTAEAAKLEVMLPPGEDHEAAPAPESQRTAAGPAPDRPLRAGEAQGKRFADKAGRKFSAGDLEGAKELLVRATEADPDNLGTRLTACALASRLKAAEFGEEQCGEAVYLAAYPPKHALPVPDAEAAAFLGRAALRLETGAAGACEDLKLALKKASSSWAQAAQARALAQERCTR
ncbi:MAG: tetratricopeptide repeat protein [Elusimicrobiales bacterium]|nr:tetratricopeptide repeat protein [Elusimicrobiales bacterium]